MTNELGWSRLGAFQPDEVAAGGGPFGVVGFDDGYVVSDEESGTVHFSPDGVKWTPVKLPHPKGAALGVLDLATNGQRVVAVGAYTPCRMAAWEENGYGRCRDRPASWVSDDGLTWRSSEPWTGSVGPAGQGGSQFHHVWTIPTGGWDVTQAFYTGDDSDDGPFVGPVLWHSDDGISWRKLRGKPSEPTTDCDPYWSADAFDALADRDGRRLAIEYPGMWCEDDEEEEESAAVEPTGPTVSISSDGRRYDRIGEFPGFGGIDAALAPIGIGPWVLVGARHLSDPDAEVTISEAAVSTSNDLATWTTSVLPVPAGATASIWDLVHGSVGYVATGVASSPSRNVTWLSGDATSWRIADVEPAEGLSPGALVDGPAGILGLGSLPVSDDPEEEAYRLVVWRLSQLP